MRSWFAAAALLMPLALPAQDATPEVTELRRRVAVIRGNMTEITQAAEQAARMMTADSALRFLTPMSVNAGFFRELYYHGGGPPETGNADDASLPGIAILPVRSWSSGLGVAAVVEKLHRNRRTVITIGPRIGKPTLPVGDLLIDNGGGNTDSPPLNDLANIVAWWTFYSEFVAAASRVGWQTGVYLSSPAAGAEAHNNRVRFRMPGATKPVAIPAGQLGRQYLDGIDAMLNVVGAPRQQAVVGGAAALLLAARKRGNTVFVSSCGHYLLDELPRDSLRTPFRPIDWRWDMGQRLTAAKARGRDAILWFGFGAVDCPHAPVSDAFLRAGLDVVTLTGPTVPPAGSVAWYIPAHWTAADALVKIPFSPGHVGPVASVEMLLHYLWIKRLMTT